MNVTEYTYLVNFVYRVTLMSFILIKEEYVTINGH